jgi:molybdopterin converting factor small subunit
MAALRVRCRLFARYAEVVGRDEVTIELPPGAVVSDALAALRRTVRGADRLPQTPLVAINLRHVLPGTPLQDGDELALLPPLAGG